jgi:hypothetical protein
VGGDELGVRHILPLISQLTRADILQSPCPDQLQATLRRCAAIHQHSTTGNLMDLHGKPGSVGIGTP